MKYLKIIKQTTLAICVLIILSSCVSKRKIAEMTKIINEKKTVEKNLETKIASMDEVRANKTAIGELDDKSNESIKKVLDNEKKGIAERTDALDKMNEALTAKKRIKIKDFEAMQINVVAANAVVAQKGESINFVNQLLKQTTFVKFNSAAFFEGGGFKIPENKMEEAKVVFSPIVDSLVVFVKKFPKLRLNSSIIASGYADATGFGPGALVDLLTSNIGKAVASKEELNSELSRLRAEEVASILTNIYNDRIKDNPNANQFNTQFFKIGKGEELPNKKITNYEINDERRRIVVIYWNALPE
jgi:outer membrane protein OmpA-like peptidoglycan-associated protein